jgi:HD-like signal output (HDOD) protein/nitrogen-specific signal transduction histidine kinase
MEIEQSIIDRISTLKELPSLPHIIVKLMEACHDENGSLGDIAEILTNDPSLCAKVLRLVNSAYYGLGSRVEGIDQAVAYLGTDAVKNIAICSAVYQAFNSRKGDSGFNLKVFWWHSLKCALLSRIFAREIAYGSPEEAFVAGLLHDIGKLALWVNFSDKYTELNKQYEHRPEMLAAGESQLGATHSQIGAWLLDRWKFQSFVADSALYHHEPLERIADALPLVQIVYTANKLSGQTVDGRGDGIRVAEKLYGFSQEQVIGFLARSDEELGEVARSFGIEIEAPQESAENLSDKDRETQENLVREVRDISLLLGTIRNLVAAQEEKDILKVLQEGLQILFDVRHILFFLYDDENKRLVGKAVEGHEATRISDLIIPMELEKSLLVSCLSGGKALDSFSLGQNPDLVITDVQMIRFLRTDGMLCLPLAVRGEYVAVIVVGLDPAQRSHLGKHFKLLEMFINEAALTLRVEQLRERQLRKIQSERAAASFAMARKVVHEVNNPLAIMKNYLKILGIKLKKQGIELDEIGILNEEIDRVAHILGGLTQVSEKKSRKWAPVDINALVNDLVKLTAESLMKGKKVAVHVDLDPALPKLMSERDSLKQILINLMKNASEAMTNGGNLYFKTRHRGTPLEGGGESRGFVEVTVSDDGPGISDKMKKRIFEPFVSSKGGGHSGLGLSIVLNLINGLKGSLVCQSEEGKGTRFKIELPVVK